MGKMITTESLFWLSGLSLAIGGIMATLGWILFALWDVNHTKVAAPSWLILNGMIILSGVLMALGLPGFYGRQAAQSGWLGLIGFVLMFVGIVIPYITVQSIETVTAPNIPPRMMNLVAIGAPSLFIGSILTGLAIWQAGVYPQWLAILLIISVLLGLLAQLIPMPAWLGRNIISTGFTGTIFLMGLTLMALSIEGNHI